MKVNIICIKWGTKFGPEYVNRLHSMVKRNITRDYRFICLTDRPEGIEAGIDVRDIPETGIKAFDEREPWVYTHGWLKVSTFVKTLHDIKGPTLFLDLDVVIVDKIDDFFDVPGDFVVIRKWTDKIITGNTSVYRFNAGAHADALDYLKNNLQKVLSEVRNEQEFITHYLHKQGKVGYWPLAWCRSFKRHCLPKPLGWFGPAKVPEGAKIIIFHGKPNPEDVINGKSGKFFRRVVPVQWVSDHWR
jgi:hypothetical protein